MAQWSRADRTLYTKVVYYGPAFGGKTTNLEALHRITDPQGKSQLLTLQTVNDRTLFFDLLPFELGDILGYQVAIKVYTVPGQVRYDTTRQVVLAGADAVVFVADSGADRRDQNVWSLQNLRLNMRARHLDPVRVPVLFQFNKQDLPDAVPVGQLESLFGIPPQRALPAVAVEGRGVLETFMAACKAMLDCLVAAADDRTRREIDSSELARQIDRAFTPHMARRERGALGPRKARGEREPGLPIVPEGEDLLERAVETTVRLGDKLSTEATRSARLEREAEAFRQLSESLQSVGASFDRARIADAALKAVHQILESPVVSLVRESAPGSIELERAWGRDTDPLSASAEGRGLLARVLAQAGPCVIDTLSAECPAAVLEPPLRGLRAAIAAPLASGENRALLVAYAPSPDGFFGKQDVRFLATVTGHLAVGLEKARLHEELARHRDELEAMVAARTEQLREAYRKLRHMETTKDRLLGNLSHEMKTPLSAILSAAQALRDYKSGARERRDLVESVASSGEMLLQQLDDLFRLASLESATGPLRLAEATAEQLVQEAIEVAGHPGVQYKVDELAGPAHFDLEGLPRAVGNLIDNAVKFSPPSSLVKVEVHGTRLASGTGAVDAMTISVLDRGPGVAEQDRQRIFAPFEQGVDGLGSKVRGIGIGLYEASLIAVRHGGTLEYLPRGGGGSEFRLTVPLRPKLAGVPGDVVEVVEEVEHA